MRYGFAIDHRKCIGCHSCTVACKTENRVPLGVNRTWVKYVEKGTFPQARRVFQVTRCNHCEKPPCVEICPVSAMFKRGDGIVDFNPAQCIGCKACMQACPYDAIYLDPAWDTAAKCHFCAHRIEVGLEPACVVVCPERAIVAGDLDDSASEIAQLVGREPVRVRKPEQGTRPKLYYVDADESAIVPTAARHEVFYMWAQRNPSLPGGGAAYMPDSPFLQKNALAAYDVAHARPWDWLVPFYCWLKSIGAGVLALPAIAMAFGWLQADPARDTVLASLALIFTVATALVLVGDLSRKERFLRVLTSPQTKSWLSRGTFILVLYSALCGAFWLSGVAKLPQVSTVLIWPTVISGFLAAGYTALLFGQCEGRDLWQTPLLPVHFVLQALLSSAAVLALLPATLGGGGAHARTVAVEALAVFLILHLLIVVGEITMPHATDNAAYAARLLTRGPCRNLFWTGAVGLGGVLPLLLLWLAPANAATAAASGLLTLAGLYAFEWCFVMAGQLVPNS
jgi:Fe-S-cluster-containing dehydrogenase component/formate-dependent nitrite reductase membrane component NrfD